MLCGVRISKKIHKLSLFKLVYDFLNHPFHRNVGQLRLNVIIVDQNFSNQGMFINNNWMFTYILLICFISIATITVNHPVVYVQNVARI